MKPAAKRGPRLCWALPPLLLLLLRVGQIVCAGDCCDQITYNSTTDTVHFNIMLGNSLLGNISLKDENGHTYQPLNTSEVSFTGLTPGTRYHVMINSSFSCCEVQTKPSPVFDIHTESLTPTSVTLTWKNNDTAASNYMYIVQFQSQAAEPKSLVFNQTRAHVMDLLPGTTYTFSITPKPDNGTQGDPTVKNITTEFGQISNLKAKDIQATNLNLTWELRLNNSSLTYDYLIQVVWITGNLSLNTNEPYAAITQLQSSTLYNISVWPIWEKTISGTRGFLQLYTPPLPVSGLQVMNVSTTEITLAWKSNDSDLFKIRITNITNENKTWNETANQSSIIIGNLLPGILYSFEIFPQGPNGTEGKSEKILRRTEYSAVSAIQVINFTTTEMWLQWQSTDHASEYTYHLDIQSVNNTIQMETSDKKFILKDLDPGTLYNITIYPELKGIKGNTSFITQYTRPSQVSDIKVSTNTTWATIVWQNRDAAASTYRYLVDLETEHSVGSIQSIVTDLGITQATFSKLDPGLGYTVRITTQVGNDTQSLEPGSLSFCTDPAPVVHFLCKVVRQEPALELKWACPDGTSEKFKLDISSGDWSRVTILDGCSLGNITEFREKITNLNFSTSYNLGITTQSCNKSAPSAQNTCLTGITDPPPPKISPNITSISHNSLKVKFSGFEASHGPIQAYALVLTTGRENASAGDLKYTYEDFKKGDSDTYVTYLITVEEKRHSLGLLEESKYEVDVGNESTTLGYYNGKLDPLGSYRACVAGFTNITFRSHGRLIDGAESYVSFSPCSEAVFLPQDPGVICGAVFGCIFGALVIVAVGGFIFWRKKRKDAKNNEVSFSQIKPKKSKLIRVENFEAYFKKQQADSNCGFAEEYEDLKLIGISQPKYAAELAENRGKNRYNNVLPYDISRVKLSIQTHSTDDYINANYMPGYHSKRDFIATQGPLPNTLKDFWRMVWEKNIYAIIMLTKCVEQGRTKCEEYWPSKMGQEYGDITVANTAEIILPEWTIRDFTVKNSQTSESHPLRQFHFTSWPDHGVPDTTELLINFRFLVRDYMKQIPPESPVLVHCSAGVGRTGTFIAIDRLIYQMENENTVDVYGIVYDLRMHRPLMVQTEDQYVFLNQCVLDIIRSQKDSKVDLIYQNTTAMTIYENLAPGTTFGKTNGYIA